jgi:ferrous iron transport protein B
MNARESQITMPIPSAAERRPCAALLGNPNCGKTALFNLLTGARQKVANYAGVTVERKEGWLSTPAGRARAGPARHLQPACAQRGRAHHARHRQGPHAREAPPELLVCVTDATHLRLNLRLVLEARAWACPWWWCST